MAEMPEIVLLADIKIDDISILSRCLKDSAI